MSTKDAARKDAETKSSKEECALSMEQRPSDAAVKDVPIKLRKEECADGMERRLRTNDAAVRDAQIKLRKEECAEGMEQRSSTKGAVVKVAQNMLSMEECAEGMEQRSNNAAMKDAQINPYVEESVGDTGGKSTHLTTNLLLLGQNSKRLSLLICHIRTLLMRHAKEVLLVFLEKSSFVKKSEKFDACGQPSPFQPACKFIGT